MDSGLHCLAVIARFHEVAVDIKQLEHRFGGEQAGVTTDNLLRAAAFLGFKASRAASSFDDLNSVPLPAIALSTNSRHCVIAAISNAENQAANCLVQQADSTSPDVLDEAGLLEFWNGELVLLRPGRSLDGVARKTFNLSWFLPSLVKYKKLFFEVVLASLLLQLFALVTPLFFQVVMDKVLVHRGFTTLNVLAFGFLIIVIFDALIGGLRNYLFSHTTNRVDVELATKLFRHLLDLPLAYFEARQVGQTVARVRELETIRQFITGGALTLLIDLSFIFIFFAVLFYYSTTLSWIVLGALPLYVLLSVAITPVLRSRLNARFTYGAANQAFLTEAVTGMQTVKAQAIEPKMQRIWENQIADYVSASFKAINLGNIAGQLATLIGKLLTLAIIWVGSYQVIAGAMTVGQLVAFNMIVGRVTDPIQKLVQLWQDFQQAGISLKRLGDILNTPTESGAGLSRGAIPDFSGGITFERVRFRYQPDSPLALDELSFSIAAGEMIGVVGRSGSGKSTLASIIQRLYVPDAGRVLLDGNDLATLDPAWLRRTVGMVQQESFLFNRSVRDNIAIADTGTSLDRVVECAKIAGAHEFIVALPRGYDTVIEEQGSNLSGGQRQRIAIARALLGDPAILILDEATSALDYEAEHIFQQNLAAIRKNRTLIIIAHRLSTVRHCDRTLVIDRGRLLESGNHEQLLRSNGFYARMHRLQHPVLSLKSARFQGEGMHES
jgi:ATP-binding cassette, subfamily B, bacterial HlyB/CyaB